MELRNCKEDLGPNTRASIDTVLVLSLVGKDKLIFTTEEELSKPSTALIDIDTYETDEKGPVLDNGEINFHCTCAGTMFSGPCNIEIRDFLTCSNKDKSPEKCMEQFEAMFNCELDYPEIYDIQDRLKGVENKDDNQDDQKKDLETKKTK